MFKTKIRVCPTPGQALVAIGAWQEYDEGLFLYHTDDNKCYPATWVEDFYITQEHRFFKPVTFKLINRTTPEELIKAGLLNETLVCIPEKTFKIRAKILIKSINLTSLTLSIK